MLPSRETGHLSEELAIVGDGLDALLSSIQGCQLVFQSF